MPLRTYAIETWGCQMNVLDSEHLEGLLRARGLSAVASAEDADVALLNTCSVREKAVQKVLSRLGELRRARLAAGRPRIVGLCGCVAEQEKERLFARSEVLDFVLGPGRLAHLPVALDQAEAGEHVCFTGFTAVREIDSHLTARPAGPRQFVTAVHGCSRHCSFCVVPFTRGHERSRPYDEIIAEVRHLAETVRNCEVTLLGQTVNAYCCPVTGATFADLLTGVCNVEGLWRVQFLTSHPSFLTAELIETIATAPRLGRYMHVPFQTGSNGVLRRMRRGYTREGYLERVSRLRDAAPHVALSTDVIVGFPGESEEDFADTLALVREVHFGQLYGFAFSPRPRTPAARYGGRVPTAVAKERLARLFELQGGIQLELNQALIGARVEVLVDGPAKRGAGLWQGRGDDNRVVNFLAWKGIAPGDLATVTITGATAHALIGETARDWRGDSALQA